MAASSPLEAVEALIVPLQRVVSLVVPSGRGVFAIFPRPSGLEVEHIVSFPQSRPLRLAGTELFLDASLNIQILRLAADRSVYEIAIAGYRYAVLDQYERELLAYHHHPSARNTWCTYPHLHVKSTPVFAGKAHLATGPVSLSAVVRMLIEDPAIPVASLRPDWPRVLDAAQQELQRAFSWE